MELGGGVDLERGAGVMQEIEEILFYAAEVPGGGAEHPGEE